MKCSYACQSAEHLRARRGFLGQMTAGLGAVVGGLGWFTHPVAANQLKRDQKRIVVINMHGGLSQLESWDPKPGTATGGPFRAIPTSVPGIHVSELLPYTAQQMHHLALVRGVNTNENDHGKGQFMMTTGRRQAGGASFPKIGAVAAKLLGDEKSELPGHIQIVPGGSGNRANDAAYLGPKYSGVVLGNGNPPQNSKLPKGVSQEADGRRHVFRRKINEQFAMRRRTALTDVYTSSYEQALRLMQKRSVFDVTQEPEKDVDRYGKTDFGRQCLLARRLLEKGITFVQVRHSNYDTHNENFNFHLEHLNEFDRPFASLVSDLADRGMLDSTLLVVMSEFGRTPRINHYYGRDHWGKSWSVCLAGAKIQRGAVLGKTSKDGTEVVDHEVDHANLFHTYLQALGVDSHGHFEIDGRQIPIAEPSSGPIEELFA